MPLGRVKTSGLGISISFNGGNLLSISFTLEAGGGAERAVFAEAFGAGALLTADCGEAHRVPKAAQTRKAIGIRIIAGALLAGVGARFVHHRAEQGFAAGRPGRLRSDFPAESTF